MATLHRYDPASEFYTDEGCYITELSNTSNDEDCSIALARVKPGVTTEVHYLKGTVERYVILEGEGEMTSGNQQGHVLQPMDTLVIKADEPQSIRNTGTQDLLFLCVCTPRFQQTHYRTKP
jgi:mannose-6-phosphate isomerase-like protein (cupin superfamily)